MIIYSHFFHFEILDTRVGLRHGSTRACRTFDNVHCASEWLQRESVAAGAGPLPDSSADLGRLY